ncbi:WSSV466 [White spot syndrome virus]|uniref:WSSV466 n=1 Tax=White spot syndrome virus TaxID=342409 RepID=A0A2I6SCD1_9VIRU|nr:WSSV466 [White spot syndrome virus]
MMGNGGGGAGGELVDVLFDVVVVVGDGNYGNTVAVCSSCS